jgi:hypothetical protein
MSSDHLAGDSRPLRSLTGQQLICSIDEHLILLSIFLGTKMQCLRRFTIGLGRGEVGCQDCMPLPVLEEVDDNARQLHRPI